MASPLLVHPSGEGRDIVHVRPDGREWKYIDFRAVRLEPGQTIHDRTGSDEVIAVVIAGSIDVECGATSWSRVGRREDPFSGAPASVYFPADCKYALRALTSCEVAICAAPARGPGRPPRLLPCGDGYVRGEGHAQRTIYNVMMDEGGASTLFVTEVITKAGNWSSYPPHKHDEDNPPLESQLEDSIIIARSRRRALRFSASTRRPAIWTRRSPHTTGTSFWFPAATTSVPRPRNTRSTTSTCWPGRSTFTG